MTEPSKPTPTKSNTDKSFDFIEAADGTPPITESSTSDTSPPTITETFSYDSQELLEPAQVPSPHVPDQVQVTDQVPPPQLSDKDCFQGTPTVVATKVQIVDDIPSSSTSSSSSKSKKQQESTTSYNENDYNVDTNISDNNNNNNNNNNNEEQVDEISRERKIGAGITIGIISAPICGPVIAVIAGVAAAYGTSKSGFTGDACRAAGDIALVAKEKVMEVDKKHDIMSKTKENANQIMDRAKDANEKHRIMENLKKLVHCTLKNVAAALQFAADKMKETRENSRNRGARTVNAGGRGDETCVTGDNAFSYEKVSVDDVEGK